MQGLIYAADLGGGQKGFGYEVGLQVSVPGPEIVEELGGSCRVLAWERD